MRRREKEKGYVSLMLWGLQRTRIWWDISFHNFKSLIETQGNTRDHDVLFLESIGSYAKDVDLCMREFSKSLTDQAYTWYVNLKPGSKHD